MSLTLEKMLNKKLEAENLRRKYPVGTRLELVSMDDSQAPPPGTRGTVRGVDDAGNILMSWDNGSSLNLILEVDAFKKIKDVQK